MVKLDFSKEIIKKLADKYDISEEVCEKHTDYIVRRTKQMMEEEDTLSVRLGELGIAYLSLPILKVFKENNNVDKPQRKERYRKLVEFLEQEDIAKVTRKKLARFPRFLSKYYKGGMNLKESEVFQNE